MEDKYILTLDYGTQSARASIFDDKGNILVIEKVPYEPAYFSDEPGHFEQNADFYWNSICKATKKIAVEKPDLLSKVKGIVATAFRDTAVLLDKDRKPIRPVILWLDQRVAHPSKPLPAFNRFCFWIVGMAETIRVQRAKSMANWYRENEPENWAKTDKYVNISTYFNYCLTGELKDTPSNQTGHYPMDYKHNHWFSTRAIKFPVFGIEKNMLCELVNNYDIIGYVTPKASEESGLPIGLPLYASGTDKSSESLGNGCLRNNIASISYGTASTIEITSNKYVEPELFLPAYPSCMKGKYNLEVQIYRGYWMLNWFKTEFAEKESIEANIANLAVLDVLNKKMLEIEPGCEGLILQPYWGPSLKKPNAKGAIIGFSDHHTRIHVYRAIVEGIAYSLRESLEGMERQQHKRVKELTCSGGGSTSTAICQITADIFGLPVKRIQTIEAASLGAAIVGFVASKHYANEEIAIKNMVHYSTVFLPNPANHQKYNYLYKQVYVKLYKRLRHLYKNIRIFSKTQFD